MEWYIYILHGDIEKHREMVINYCEIKNWSHETVYNPINKYMFVYMYMYDLGTC